MTTVQRHRQNISEDGQGHEEPACLRGRARTRTSDYNNPPSVLLRVPTSHAPSSRAFEFMSAQRAVSRSMPSVPGGDRVSTSPTPSRNALQVTGSPRPMCTPLTRPASTWEAVTLQTSSVPQHLDRSCVRQAGQYLAEPERRPTW
jgi:hypothetical protein